VVRHKEAEQRQQQLAAQYMQLALCEQALQARLAGALKEQAAEHEACAAAELEAQATAAFQKRIQEAEAQIKKAVEPQHTRRQPLPGEPPLPRGVEFLPSSLPLELFSDRIAALAAEAKSGKEYIAACQPDTRRRLGKPLAEADPLKVALLKALDACGKLAGRVPSKAAPITSLVDCARQEWHWDYRPDRVTKAHREHGVKPVSVIVGLSRGARLWVFDFEREMPVCVWIEPGEVLMFEADVLHAGSCYVYENTRLHLYLDVPGCVREQGAKLSLYGPEVELASY
jgi:hypothetical protein